MKNGLWSNTVELRVKTTGKTTKNEPYIALFGKSLFSNDLDDFGP